MSVGGRFTVGVRRALSAAIAVLALSGASRADDDDRRRIPPENFSGAEGNFNRPKVAADPVRVQAEDPITYTVRITARDWTEPPQRPQLAELGFPDDFYIEDVAPPDGSHPDENTWEFVYRLKPKNTAVTSIPAFKFVFLRPKPGTYEGIYTEAIDITVGPRKQVDGSTATGKPIIGPEMAFSLADGDALRRADGRFPAPVLLVLALAVPPIGCVVSYLVWRRLYPDDARRAHRRRSRAAQDALRALRAVGKQTDPEKQARGSAGVVARYLQQRLDWKVAEPTPAEVESYLHTQGVSDKLAGRTTELLRTCAAVCFDPERPAHADLPAAASEVILALEVETWSD